LLIVGTGGDVKVTTSGGDTVVLPSIGSGTLLPLRVRQVFSTGTTASGIVSIW
jgi:hypothetical protein